MRRRVKVWDLAPWVGLRAYLAIIMVRVANDNGKVKVSL